MGKKLTHTVQGIKSTLKTSTSLVVEKINDSLAKIFYDNRLATIAKETNFVQRSSSRIKGNEFVQAMVLASIDPKSTSLSGIIDNLRTISPEAEMTVSALRQRINTSEAQDFIKEVYRHVVESKLNALSTELNAISDKFNAGALQHFSKVLVHDSSCCHLNESLENHFKGSAGLASKSLVKIDVIHDLKTNKLEETFITDVKEPDQTFT